MQSLNQFAQTAERGQIALRGEGNHLISVLVDSTEAGTITAGDLVVLSGSTKGLPMVKKYTGAGGEIPLGFAVYNVIQNEFKANMMLEIALTSVCMIMTASQEITAGADVSYDAGTGKITTGGTAIGKALTKADADNDIFVVYIKTL